ncbi:MAG: hypothetical protein R6V23_13740 [Bacteroidales bacterium]
MMKKIYFIFSICIFIKTSIIEINAQNIAITDDETEIAGGYDIAERKAQVLLALEKAHIYIEQLNDEIKDLKEENHLLKDEIQGIK